MKPTRKIVKKQGTKKHPKTAKTKKLTMLDAAILGATTPNMGGL